MLAFTDAWLPPPQAVVDRPPPVVAPPPLSRASSRPHACTSAGRIPCSSLGGGVGARARCRPSFFFSSFPSLYPSSGSMDLEAVPTVAVRRSVRNFQKVRSGARSGDGGVGGAVALAAMLPMEQGLRLVLQVTDVRPAAGALRRSQVRARVLVAFMAHLIRARAIRAGTIIRVLDYLFMDSNINTRHQHKELPRDEATFGYVNEAKETKSSSSLCHKVAD
uniref:Uncharacterized protein n=1 Tax=Oryza glumipatula TaxID=40148 RepID=A0A0D9ZDY7_9ORYZ